MRLLSGHQGDNVHTIRMCLTSPLYYGNLLVAVEEFSYVFIHVVGGYTVALCRYPNYPDPRRRSFRQAMTVTRLAVVVGTLHELDGNG